MTLERVMWQLIKIITRVKQLKCQSMPTYIRTVIKILWKLSNVTKVAYIGEYQQLSSKLVLLIHQALKYVIISTINYDEVILHNIWSTIMF